MADYRVNLEIYNGPLDLLLYLIRRDEVDIYDIPIARITAQYMEYVEVLQALDPNLAGDFLVMAATLMEIKTRMLLPTPPPEEGGEEGLEIDPRAELVRQLLEYKAFRDAAEDLRDARAERALKFERRPPRFQDDSDDSLDIEYAQVWDLFDAFSKLMEATGQRLSAHEVIYDDTPVELHATDIVDRLRREGPMRFDHLFEGRAGRSEMVGLFLALLELIRQQTVQAVQSENFGQIEIQLKPHPPHEPGEEETQDAEGEDLPAGQLPDAPINHVGEAHADPAAMGDGDPTEPPAAEADAGQETDHDADATTSGPGA